MTEAAAELLETRSLKRSVTANNMASKPISAPVVVGLIKIIDLLTIPVAAAITTVGILTLWLETGALEISRYLTVALLGSAIQVFLLHQVGSYQFKRLGNLRWQVSRVTITWLSTVSLGLVANFLTKSSDVYSRGWIVGWVVISLVMMIAARIGFATTIRYWSRIGRLSRSVIIVGGGEHGLHLIHKLQQMPNEAIRIVGIFDDRRSRIPEEIGGCPVLGTTDDLLAFARQNPPDEVIVAMPLQAAARLQVLFRKLMLLPIDLRLSFDTIGDHLPIRGISHIGDVPVVDIVDKPLKHWSAVLKWLEDKVLTAGLLLAASPLMLMIALLIKLDSRGPVFFKQERFGFNNDVIRVFKFRTMYTDRGDITGAQRTVRNDPRVTRIGRYLRMLSLDELPQLINVMRGDMSLVGPRPHAITMRAGDRLYHDAVDEYFARHRVRPGLTGWAQVNGLRGETDTIEKARRRVEYDLYYIDNWSLWLDVKIVLMTFKVFVGQENAY
ncbi:MAG TPA: undecaprenyl-phosphate glucose phosphotransferase [Stellaceae bacterium]|nr:undecaprenyl-phosphate glucose phosphotransferase [Stellaceae bacterium]